MAEKIAIAKMSKIPIHAPVAVYLRKSRLDEDSNADETLIHHQREIEQFIGSEGFTNVTWFREVVSGESIQAREQMKRLLSDVENGKFVAVITVALDRLTRGSMMDNYVLTETFRNAECVVITTTGRTYDFNNDESIMFNEFEMMIARNELRLIKRRLQKGKRNNFENGNPINGMVPYGYIRDKNDNSIHVDEGEAKVYQWIVEQYLSGRSSTKIAHELNRNKIETPSAKPGSVWSGTTIMRMLTNPFYTGMVVLGRTKTTQDKATGKSHYRRIMDSDRYELRQGKHDALIDESTFQRLKDIHARKTETPVRSRNPGFRTTGLFVCVKCGYRLSIFAYKRNGKFYYNRIKACYHKDAEGNKCEGNKGAKEPELLEIIRQDMQRYKAELFAPNHIENDSVELPVDPVLVEESNIQKSEEKIERAKMLFIEGDISKDEYQRIKQIEEFTIDKSKAELKKLRVSPDMKRDMQRKEWSEVDIEELFHESTDPATFNHVIKSLIDSVILDYTTDVLKLNIRYK